MKNGKYKQKVIVKWSLNTNSEKYLKKNGYSFYQISFN